MHSSGRELMWFAAVPRRPSADWHVAVFSIDLAAGPAEQYLAKGQSNNMVEISTTGVKYREPLLAAAGWHRAQR